MLKALYHLVQITALIVVFGLCLAQTGTVDAVAGPYRISGQTGFFLGAGFVFILVLLALHRMWLWVMRLPAAWARYRRDVHLVKGHHALTRALSALSSGDYKIAYTHSVRAQKLLPEFRELPAVLMAASAERQGMDEIAQAALATLLDTPARDLGVRGLVNGATARGDMAGALKTARAALAQTPRVPMLGRLVYDLECRNGDYASALTRQKYLLRHHVLAPDQARRDRVRFDAALARAARDRGDHKKALVYARRAVAADPSFTPAACELIDIYRAYGKTRAAQSVLHQSYARAPHPDLVLRHEQMAPEKVTVSKRIRYHNKLYALSPNHPQSLLLMARVLMQDGVMGDAKTHLDRAAAVSPSRNVYKALAVWAERHGDRVAERDYLARGMSARQDPVWFCPFTGKIYDEWVPLTLPEHQFGTVIWGVPDQVAPMSAPPSNMNLPVFDVGSAFTPPG